MARTNIGLRKDQPQIYPIDDLSGGVQTKTTSFLNRKNELQDSLNAITTKVGGVSKRPGYAQTGNNLTSTTSTSTSSSTTTTSTSTSTTTTTSTSTSTTA